MGRIELRGNQAVVEVPDGWEARLVKLLDGQALGDRRVRVWTGGAAGRRPRRARTISSGWPGCLDLESRAEAQRAAEQARRLSPAEAQQTATRWSTWWSPTSRPGLGGRYLVQLGKRGRAPAALDPAGRRQPGGPLAARGQGRAAAPRRGLRARASGRSAVALDRLPEDLADHEAWRLDLSFDEVAVQRQRAALEQARPGPRRPLWPSCATCSWASGSRSSASIPRSGRWTPA